MICMIDVRRANAPQNFERLGVQHPLAVANDERDRRAQTLGAVIGCDDLASVGGQKHARLLPWCYFR